MLEYIPRYIYPKLTGSPMIKMIKKKTKDKHKHAHSPPTVLNSKKTVYANHHPGYVALLSARMHQHNSNETKIHPVVQINFQRFAMKKPTPINPKMLAIIPKNQAKLSECIPGMGTFIPNRPQIKFKGTRIVAIVVILPNTSLARLLAWIESTDS